MKKGNKLLKMVLVMVMAGMVMTGCSAKPAGGGTSASGDKASFKVGFLDQADQAPAVTRMREIIRTAVETAGGELVCDTTGNDSTDAQINAVEKLIGSGVKGIIITPIADSVLPTIMTMCEEAKVYLAITFRSVQDKEVAALLEQSEYYAGNCYEDEENAGYQAMSKAFEKKTIKKVALLALNIGDNTSDARAAGIERACEENGAEIVAEVRNIAQASDGVKAVESFVASYPDLDCIAVASCQVPSAITALPGALKDIGKTPDEISIVSCDTGDELSALFEGGYAAAVSGGHLEIDRGSTAVLVCNAILGHKLGNPAHISIPYIYFEEEQDTERYSKYVEGTLPIWTSEEIAKNLIITDDNGLTSEDVLKYIANYSLDDLEARHADLIK